MATRREVEEMARRRGLDPRDPQVEGLITEPDDGDGALVREPAGTGAGTSYWSRYNPFEKGGAFTREGLDLGKAARFGFRHSTIGELGRLAGRWGPHGEYLGPSEPETEEEQSFEPSSFPEKVVAGATGMAGSPIATASMVAAPLTGPFAPAVLGAGFGAEGAVRTALAGGDAKEIAKAAAVEGAGGVVLGAASRYATPLLPKAVTPIGHLARGTAAGTMEGVGYGVGAAPTRELVEHGIPSREELPAAAQRVGEEVAEQAQFGAGMALPFELARTARLRRRLDGARKGRTDVTTQDATQQVTTAETEPLPESGTGGGGPQPTAPPGAPGDMVTVRFTKGRNKGQQFRYNREIAQRFIDANPDELVIVPEPPAAAPGGPAAPPPTPPAAPAPGAAEAAPPAPTVPGLEGATERRAVRGGEIEVVKPTGPEQVLISMPNEKGEPQLYRVQRDMADQVLQQVPGSKIVGEPLQQQPKMAADVGPAPDPALVQQGLQLAQQGQWDFDPETGALDWQFAQRTFKLEPDQAQALARTVDAQLDREQLTELPGGGNAPEEPFVAGRGEPTEPTEPIPPELPEEAWEGATPVAQRGAPPERLPEAIGGGEVPPAPPEEGVPPRPPGEDEYLGSIFGTLQQLYERARARRRAGEVARAGTEEAPPEALRPPEAEAPQPPPIVPPERLPEEQVATAPEVPPPPEPPVPPPSPVTPPPTPEAGSLPERVEAADATLQALKARGGVPEVVLEHVEESVDAARQGLIELGQPQVEEGRVAGLDPAAQQRRIALIEESLKLAHDLPGLPEPVQALMMGEIPGVYFERGEEGMHPALQVMADRYPERIGVFSGRDGDVLYRRHMMLDGEGHDFTEQILQTLDEQGRLHEVADLFTLPVERERPPVTVPGEEPPTRGRAGKVIAPEAPTAPEAAGAAPEEGAAPTPSPWAARRPGEVVRALAGKRVRFTGAGGVERTGYLVRQLGPRGELQIHTGQRGPQGKAIYTQVRPEQILGEAESLSGPVLEGVPRRGFQEKLGFRDIEAEERRAAGREEPAEMEPPETLSDVGGEPGQVGQRYAALIGGRIRAGRLRVPRPPVHIEGAPEHVAPARPEVERPTRPESEQPGAGTAPEAPPVRRIPQDQWDFRPGDVLRYQGKDWIFYEAEGNKLRLIDPDNPKNTTLALFTKIERAQRPGTGESADFTPEAKKETEGALSRLAEREAGPRRGRAGVVQPGPAITAPGRPSGAGAPAARPGGRQAGAPPPTPAGRGAEKPAPSPLRPVAKGIAEPVLKALQQRFPLGSEIEWGEPARTKTDEAGRKTHVPGTLERGTVVGYRMAPDGYPAPVVALPGGGVKGITRQARPRPAGEREAPRQPKGIIGAPSKTTQAPAPEKPQLPPEEVARRARETPAEARSQQAPHPRVPGPEAQRVRYTDPKQAAQGLRHWWVQGRLQGGQAFHGMVSGKATDRYVEVWYGRDPNTLQGRKSRWVLPESIEYRLPRGERPGPPAGEPAAPITGTARERRNLRQEPPEVPDEALWPPSAGLRTEPPGRPPGGRR
jgi:hypothetical protein